MINYILYFICYYGLLSERIAYSFVGTGIFVGCLFKITCRKHLKILNLLISTTVGY